MPEKTKLEEYLRRNLLHASSVGATAGANSAIERLKKMKRPPKWLLAALDGISRRASDVAHEMATHRDELSPYRKD